MPTRNTPNLWMAPFYRSHEKLQRFLANYVQASAILQDIDQ